MLTFKEFVVEARKNPELNPKESIYSVLESEFEKVVSKSQYITPGIYNAFISLTEIEKLGINPRSKWDTPLGIYSYPLDWVLDKCERTKSLSELPFAGEEPYVNYFQVSGNIIHLSEMKSIEAADYYRKLGEYYADAVKPHLDWKTAVDQVERYVNEAGDRATYSNYVGGRFWYVTMKVAKDIAIYKGSKAPIQWNALFRELGIDGFIDNGIGIIHNNEPTQAVFFSKNVIKNNKRLLNKNYKKEHLIKSAWDLEDHYKTISGQHNFSEILEGIANGELDDYSFASAFDIYQFMIFVQKLEFNYFRGIMENEYMKDRMPLLVILLSKNIKDSYPQLSLNQKEWLLEKIKRLKLNKYDLEDAIDSFTFTYHTKIDDSKILNNYDAALDYYKELTEED